MSLVIGHGPDEVPSVTITLLSNASLDLFPQNRNTNFTNALRSELKVGEYAKRLVVQIRKIFIPTKLLTTENIPTEPVNIMQIQLRDVEAQFVNSSPATILASFDLKKASAKEYKTSVDYITHEFHDSPWVSLINSEAKYFSVTLTTVTGTEYPLVDNLPPVLLEMNVQSDQASHPELTVYCASHTELAKNLYPQNTLSNFSSKLVKPMALNEWEVALASITLPALRKVGEELKARISFCFSAGVVATSLTYDNDRAVTYEYSIKKTDTFKDICEAFETLLANDPQWNEKVIFGRRKVGPDGEAVWIAWAVSERNSHLMIRFNPLLSALLGRGYKQTTTIVKTTKPQDIVQKKRIDRINLAIKDYNPQDLTTAPLGMLYCNIVKPTPVGDTLSNLLDMIPMSAFEEEGARQMKQKMYKPKRLNYREINSHEFNEIQFKLCRPDGQEFSLIAIDPQTMVDTLGAVVELRFRPKPQYPPPDETGEPILRKNWQRDRMILLAESRK